MSDARTPDAGMPDAGTPPAAPSEIAVQAASAPALPVRWHRRVLGLAFPIVLANLTQPILGAVDTAVAGHLDSAS
ncbi:Na+-driven multidrug efflux pump [Paraburkholderia atlantica]